MTPNYDSGLAIRLFANNENINGNINDRGEYKWESRIERESKIEQGESTAGIENLKRESKTGIGNIKWESNTGIGNIKRESGI